MKTKITALEAWKIISEFAQPLASTRSNVQSAVAAFASADIIAPIALPPFDNSAVDGFALGSAGALHDSFHVVATIGAGEHFDACLGTQEACRIMTGAKVPTGTRAIAMQEHVDKQSLNPLQVTLCHSVGENENIRRAGEDVAAGAVILAQGKRITPADIGLLSALGISDIEVHRKPTIAIVSTGSELVEPGQILKEGQVYYCTGPMLDALCVNAHAVVHSVSKVDDDKMAIVLALRGASAADVIIMVGGMADGLYDHGRAAFEELGVEPIFFEGQWRPGKPLFFGRLGERLVFGLPGNPVAAFVMFKLFIEPAIEKMRGGSSRLDWKRAKAAFEIPAPGGKSLFLRGRLTQNAIELLQGQGSHQLYSLSQADVIVWVQPDRAVCDEVDYIPLDA